MAQKQNTRKGAIIYMLGYILCVMGGAAFGVIAMCLFSIAGQDDRRQEKLNNTDADSK